MSDRRPFVVQWRDAVLSSVGPSSPPTRLVLVALSLFMDSRGGSCWPNVETLAEATALGERTVRRHLEKAEEAGWIGIVQEAGRGRAWRTNSYTARIPPGVRSERPEPTEEERGGGAVRVTGAQPASDGVRSETTGGAVTGARGAVRDDTGCGQSDRSSSHELDGELDHHPERAAVAALEQLAEDWRLPVPDRDELERLAGTLAERAAGSPIADRLPVWIEAQAPGTPPPDSLRVLPARLRHELGDRSAAPRNGASPTAAATEPSNSASGGGSTRPRVAGDCVTPGCSNVLPMHERREGHTRCSRCRGEGAGPDATRCASCGGGLQPEDRAAALRECWSCRKLAEAVRP